MQNALAARGSWAELHRCLCCTKTFRSPYWPLTPDPQDHIYNTHVVLSSTGERVALYRKVGPMGVFGGSCACPHSPGAPHSVHQQCAPHASWGHSYTTHHRPCSQIHLFDVDVPSGPVLMESRTTAPGDRLVACGTPAGHLGLTIWWVVKGNVMVLHA